METTERNQIIEKFRTALKESDLSNNQAAEILGVNVWHVNCLGEKNRHKISPAAVTAMADFLNSGKKLSECQHLPKEKKPLQEVATAAEAQEFFKKAAKPEPEKKMKPESNEAIQNRLAQEFIKAMEEAGMNNIEAGRLLGVTPESLALVRNDRYRCSCQANVWEAIKKFTQSGKPLKDYHYLAPEIGIKTKETLISSAEGHKFILDIEINLTLNGRRIEV